MNGRLGVRYNGNLPLLLVAFTVAVVIKFSVLESVQLGTRLIDAQITYGQTSGDIVVYDRIDTVRVEVRGQASDLVKLNNLGVVVDIPKGKLGSTDITLGAKNVNLPPFGDFEVVSIDPDAFTVQIEPRVRKTVEVRTELVDEPAAGARPVRDQIVARPGRVDISGPKSQVDRVDFVRARVSLEGHARTFEDTVTLESPEPLVQIAPRRIIVEVTMEEPKLSIPVGSIRDGEPPEPS